LGDERTVRQYGGIRALPETLLIDRDGRIASQHVGIASKTDYERQIGDLLGVNGESRQNGQQTTELK
jgi:hypothetical protein